jgi:hypothetical protein
MRIKSNKNTFCRKIIVYCNELEKKTKIHSAVKSVGGGRGSKVVKVAVSIPDEVIF